MKAVFLDYGTMGPDLDLQQLYRLFPDVELYDETTHDQMVERIRDAEYAFTNKMRFTDELLGAADKLRYIGLTATGTDNIDLVKARELGIAVANIRDYCTRSVVEHVFGALLMLTHSLGGYIVSVRAGDWQRSRDFSMLTLPVRELGAMTLGVVGYGSLGRGVARQASAFGMEVLVAARPGGVASGHAVGVGQVVGGGHAGDRVAFDELLTRTDVVSLHCPLNEATHHLFNRDTFAKMKPGAFLVNTARGGLVDSAALVDALSDGRLAGAAIDVLATEPPRDGDPLLDYAGDNLVITPHIAWATDEARQAAIDELARNAEAFMNGTERNRVV